MSDILGFSYIFEKEPDYGTYNEKTGEWSGMVAQLMNDVSKKLKHFVRLQL